MRNIGENGMTDKELISKAIQRFGCETDNEGQVVVYTGVYQNPVTGEIQWSIPHIEEKPLNLFSKVLNWLKW